MKQKELKILAKWAGINMKQLPLAFPFEPHRYSKQLDMLEDKMIKETGIYEYHIRFSNNRVRSYYYPISFQVHGEGKTKNEARLNAILNYINETK